LLICCNGANPQATEEFHLALLKDNVLLGKADWEIRMAMMLGTFVSLRVAFHTFNI